MENLRFFRFPIILICIPFCLGILLGDITSIKFLSIFCFCVFLFIINFFLKGKYFLYGLILISFFLGISSFKLKNEKIEQVSNLKISKNYYTAKLLEKLGNTEKTIKYILEIYLDSGVIKSISYVDKSYLNSIKTGDLILFNKEIFPIQKSEPFSGFDYKNFMMKRGITHSLFLSKKDILKIENNSNNLIYKREKLKDEIYKNLSKNNLSKNTIGFTIALILGDRKYLDKDIMDNFSNAGVTHLLAVSGLHVGIFILIIMFLLSPLERFKNGKLIKIYLAIILIWGYAFLVNFSPSISRACTMFTFVMIGTTLKRVTNIYNSLAVSALFLLIINPNNIFEVGFQFSYLAVISIFWIQPLIKKIISVKNKIFSYLWKIISVSLSAQVGVLPVNLYYFGKIPMLFLLSNIILIPIIGVVLILGVISISLSFFEANFSWYFSIYEFIISKINFIIEYISSYKSMVLNINLELPQVIVFFSVIVFLILFIKRKKYYLLVISLLNLTVFQVLILEKFYRKINKIEIIDFNKGNMISIKNGKKIFLFSSENIDNYSTKKFDEYLKSIKYLDIEKKNLLKSIKINIKNKKILILNSPIEEKYYDIEYDYIFIKNSFLKEINFKTKNIVLDRSNNLKAKKYWENFCKINNINFYNIYDKGSFVKEI